MEHLCLLRRGRGQTGLRRPRPARLVQSARRGRGLPGREPTPRIAISQEPRTTLRATYSGACFARHGTKRPRPYPRASRGRNRSIWRKITIILNINMQTIKPDLDRIKSRIDELAKSPPKKPEDEMTQQGTDAPDENRPNRNREQPGPLTKPKITKSEICASCPIALETFCKKYPVSDHCPLISNKKWNCKPHDKGNEPRCRSITGYSGCEKFQSWFFYNVIRETARIVSEKKKK